MRTVTKQIKLDDKTVETLKQQREAFIKKFGREPGPDDPVFYDPRSKDVPLPMGAVDSIEHAGADWKRSHSPDAEQELIDIVCEGMEKVGRPDCAYAFRKCGFWVTKESIELGNSSEEDIAEWDAALEEFRQLQ